MKTKQVKLSVLTFALSGLITLSAAAQTTTPASGTTPAKTTQSSKSQTQKSTDETKTKSEGKTPNKEEFVKHLNEIQPKAADFASKAQQNAGKNPEFSNEATKLNSMVNDFKAKVDRWDSTPTEKREDYSQMLKKDWDSIKAQETKVHDMWNKTQSSKSTEKTEKPASKQAPASK